MLLRTYPNLELSVEESAGPQKQKLFGRINPVAVEEGVRFSDDFWMMYIAEAASLYKIRSGAGMQTNEINYEIDPNIYPRPGFKTAFEEVGFSFHLQRGAGRRVFLILFSKIVLRPAAHLPRIGSVCGRIDRA